MTRRTYVWIFCLLAWGGCEMAVWAQPPEPPPRDPGEVLEEVAAAIEAEQEQWSQAVESAVNELTRSARTEMRAVEALIAIAQAEEIRPIGDQGKPPGAAEREKLEQVFREARPRVAPTGGPVPPPPPPPSPSGNPAVERLKLPKTPTALQVLVEVGTASADDDIVHRIAMFFVNSLRPEAERFFEDVLAVHRGGDTEAMGVDTLTRSAYRYREAAGLLFLLREDNFYNVQAGVLRCHQEWGGPRILHVLPFLLAYENELVVRYAAELLGTLAHVDLSVPERLSLPEQARLYQAGHAAITNEVRRTLPPPVDPAWDATNPLVTALAQALESARPENQRAIAQNPQAEPKQRKTALRRLAFEGSDDSWKVIADVAATEGLWEVRGWALYIASQLVPDRAESLQRAVADTLGEEGTESARQLVLGLVECETREAVLGVASVSDQVDREVLLTILEDLANSQQDPLYWGRQSYRAVRNSITAYGAIDRERGARFYHSLMRSDRPRQREVGRYGVGELRVAEAIPDLVASVVPEEENCFRPESVCIALGKIGTPEAHNALIQMLLAEPIVMKRSRAVLSVMEEVCGLPGQSPPGAWWNGWWASVAEDRTAVAERFVRAMEELAEKTTDERLAREARGRAGSIRLQVLKQR